MTRALPPHAAEGLGAATAALAATAKATLLLLAAIAADEARALEAGTVIEVFTTSDLPATNVPELDGVEIRIWRIDGIVRAQDALSEGLPADEREAARIAGERFRRMRPRLEPMMMEAARGLAHALLDDGIDRYPAVVFHAPGRPTEVVYGMTDVARAIAIRERAGTGGRAR